MKKVIIRRDMVQKAIEKAVDNAMIGYHYELGVKVVHSIKTHAPTGELIVEAVQDYARSKGVPSEVKYWGDGTCEVRLADRASVPSRDMDYCDKSNPIHY